MINYSFLLITTPWYATVFFHYIYNFPVLSSSAVGTAAPIVKKGGCATTSTFSVLSSVKTLSSLEQMLQFFLCKYGHF